MESQMYFVDGHCVVGMTPEDATYRLAIQRGHRFRASTTSQGTSYTPALPAYDLSTETPPGVYRFTLHGARHIGSAPTIHGRGDDAKAALQDALAQWHTAGPAYHDGGAGYEMHHPLRELVSIYPNAGILGGKGGYVAVYRERGFQAELWVSAKLVEDLDEAEAERLVS